MSRRLKVLMSAYACEPGKGSEPGVGWNWAIQMARFHDVTVITRANNAPAIRTALTQLHSPVPEFVFFDPPSAFVRLKKMGLPTSWFYAIWQLSVSLRFFRRLGQFDILHHTTFNAFRWPGVWWFSPIPVILGPLGGGQTTPIRMLPLFGRSALNECLRSLWVHTCRISPFHWVNCWRAAHLLVANRDTMRRIPKRFRRKASFMLETGIDWDRMQFPTATSHNANQPLRLLWSGVLEPRKALPLALRALAIARHTNPTISLSILGSGAEEARMRKLAKELGVENCVSWLGRQPYSEVLRITAEHDIFVFTSVRDTSGNVVLEAMGAGLPVITINHQGATEMTSDSTAIRVAPTSIAETAEAIGDAVVALANSQQLRQQLGSAGRDRVKTHYDWKRKGEAMNELYLKVADCHGATG